MVLRRHVVPFAVAVMLAAPVVARATTMFPLTIEQLTERSEDVVRAHTVAVASAWDGARRIVTRAHVVVDAAYSGHLAPGAAVDVATYGGTVDGISMLVLGAPQFAAGEDVVLFLTPQAGLGTGVAELGQGKFEVVRDGAGLERLTRRSIEGVEFVSGLAPEPVLDLTLLRSHVARAARRTR